MMKKLNNQIMLITYADSMGKNLKELHTVLNRYYHNAIGGVHILPFFPSPTKRWTRRSAHLTMWKPSARTTT